MNGMHGIIFSYDKENDLRELIENRVHGSIPFGGDYRIIDFILSSMVNAGVTDVGVIMHGKCQSLLDHLGSGKSWDLSRNFGGLTLLPAFAYNEQHRGDGQFRGRVDALGSVMNYLKSIRQDYVVLSDSDTVINAPLEDVLRRHIDTGADITAVCANCFDFLRAQVKAGEKYDVVVLDPPAFTKAHANMASACRGYKEIALSAMRLLPAGGVLATHSCSYHMPEEVFVNTVLSAAQDLHRQVRVITLRRQDIDHPVLAGSPESHYLKSLWLQMLD